MENFPWLPRAVNNCLTRCCPLLCVQLLMSSTPANGHTGNDPVLNIFCHICEGATKLKIFSLFLIDKPDQIIGLLLKKAIVNQLWGTCKQGGAAFQFSHSCFLYTLDLLGVSEALPEVIFIFLANMSKRLQMLNAVYVLLNCATDYAHLEMQTWPSQAYLWETSCQYSKQLSFRPPFLKKRSRNS